MEKLCPDRGFGHLEEIKENQLSENLGGKTSLLRFLFQIAQSQDFFIFLKIIENAKKLLFTWVLFVNAVLEIKTEVENTFTNQF